MSNQYEEVTTTSWGKRIMNSFAGIIIGILMFFAAFPTIWWNEGRSVDRIKTLEQGRGLVVTANYETLEPNNQGALVHISGLAAPDAIVQDALFGVADNVLKLKRKVEMFQWKEHSKTTEEKELGGSTTRRTVYTYDKIWSEAFIDSTKFKQSEGRINPSSMQHQSQVFTADKVNLGAYTLSQAFKRQISQYVDYQLNSNHIDALNQSLKDSFILNGNEFFSGNPANPAIGAMRVRYSVTKATQVSVIGQQNNASIETYTLENGSLQLLQLGNVTADEMFATSESENSFLTWLIRVGAFMLMWLGLSRVLAPIRVIGDVVPLIGRILGAGIGLVTCIVAFVLSFITMALAWIFFRPLIGIALLVIAALFFFGGFKLIKNKLKKLNAESMSKVET